MSNEISTHPPGHSWVTARRLARELADVLAELVDDPMGGPTVAIVEPSNFGPYNIAFADRDYYRTLAGLRTMTIEPKDQIAYHLNGMEIAARQLDPRIGRLGTTWDIETGMFMGVIVSFPRDPFPDREIVYTTTVAK
jgi:hypothetical protein